MDNRSRSFWEAFSIPNLAYLQELYERYRADPATVSAEVRAAFEQWGAPDGQTALAPAAAGLPAAPWTPQQVAGAVALATAIRAYGHRAARLDPLGREPPGDPALRAETHGLREEELAALPAAIVGGPVAERAGNALAAIRALREIYQGTTGYEFEHVSNAEERHWLRTAVEARRFHPPHDPIDERQLLERLTEVGAFERFLQRAFPGQTRFSLEGLGMLVPMLDELIGAAAEAGTRCVMLGMAHRGRLNVLAHVLGKPYEQIIAEFLGHYRRSNVSPSGSSDEGWTGDVKYHLGARRAYRGGQPVEMLIALAPNPSHLEFVNPVVEGMTRACTERRDQRGPARRDEGAALAVLIHGDAAFPGQGVVAETLNLSRLPGYRTGGTIHIIANNQIGFTTPPEHGRSTLYASDLAKGFEIPVIHVNADDPEACIAATRLAHAYRERFRKDVVIDLVGYRRWGHNEGDEPSFTQPLLYARIAQHPTVRELWAQELVRRGLVTAAEVEALLQARLERLHALRRTLEQQLPGPPAPAVAAGREAGGPTGGLGHAGPAAEIETAVPAETLVALNEQLWTLPPGFHLHPKLERPIARRRAALSTTGNGAEGTIDWAHAEALAFASLLAEGIPIRLTGQDTTRGTFSQRHLVLYDFQTGSPYMPLQALPAARASFDAWDSPLSEVATLGFEYGYSIQAPEVLVLWEAQYGDFVNVAQVIIDQFIASAKAKWEQCPSLVLLLPHGYEGQGPEHSSARLERFLQLAAEDNLRIANCTTAAQYFHILRRQARLLARDPRPLVLLTPKSLLRHPLAAARLEELAQGRFQPVLDDPLAQQDRAAVRRLLLCSGKVYVDLVTATPPPAPEVRKAVAIVRVEELYPFPAEAIAELLAAYPQVQEVAWLQEEPRNMGAWTFVAPRLRDLLGGRLPLVYIGRPRRASPAEGSYEWHVQEQARVIEAAFRFEPVEAGRAAQLEVHRGD
ncbi:MAG TPA: 2-oxoglutarate dehydrogenase E1 component [Chloroflexota bacterium]|nr:2-oxoglutarate dehydrogenase E1 component [Chloroflexota bacterium]